MSDFFGTIWPPPAPGGPLAGLVPPPAMPVGAVTAYAAPLESPPNMQVEALGWMVCDGRTLQIQQYPLLFAVLQYQYGGSGEFFAIPNLQGQFLRGLAVNSTQDPDISTRIPANPANPGVNLVGSSEQDALQTHVHSYGGIAPSGTHAGGQGTPMLALGQLTNPPNPPARISSETRPVNVYVYFLIKFM